MSFAATTVWNVQGGVGSDAYGGGFDPALGGTDYSQRSTPIATGTVTSSTTTVTATGSIFTAAMVGNYITDGTTWKEITAYTSGTVVTVDSAPSWTSASISVGGALATDTKANALAVAGNTVYVKTATYAHTTNSLTFATSGTTTAPIIWKGYNTTPGDIDANFALTRPTISFTSGQFIVNASYVLFQNFTVTGTNTASLGSTSGVLMIAATGNDIPLYFDNCSFANTSANANGYAACAYDSSVVVFARTAFSATSTASAICDFTQAGTTPRWNFLGCTFSGGGNGLNTTANAAQLYYKCCFLGVGSIGLNFTTSSAGPIYILGCSFNGGTSHGVKFAGTPTTNIDIISDCIIAGYGTGGTGYGIDNASGTNSAFFFRLCNDFYNNASGNENGMSLPALSTQTESGSPFTSSSNLTPASGAKALNAAVPNPGTFPGETFSSYESIGAVQPSGGGGSSPNYGIRSGGRM